MHAGVRRAAQVADEYYQPAETTLCANVSQNEDQIQEGSSKRLVMAFHKGKCPPIRHACFARAVV